MHSSDQNNEQNSPDLSVFEGTDCVAISRIMADLFEMKKLILTTVLS